MLFITLIVILIFTLFLASKDSDSYLLKNNNVTGPLVNARIQRWHRDGFIIDAIFTLVIAYAGKSWWIILQSLLIRLSIFDLAFNYWSDLNIKYLGSTAWTDKIFVKIFGLNGAVIKSIVFAILIIGLTLYLQLK